MRKFITKHQKTGLKITFKYDLTGCLRNIEFAGEWEDEQVGKILPKIPINLQMMISDINQQKPQSAWRFSEVTEVSFKAFYKAYPRKVGPKLKTEKSWNKLSEVDKMEAILFIPELIRQKNDGTALPYPATYLNQKYWR